MKLLLVLALIGYIDAFRDHAFPSSETHAIGLLLTVLTILTVLMTIGKRRQEHP